MGRNELERAPWQSLTLQPTETIDHLSPSQMGSGCALRLGPVEGERNCCLTGAAALSSGSVCCRCGSARNGNGHKRPGKGLEHFLGEMALLSPELACQVHCIGLSLVGGQGQACNSDKNDRPAYICQIRHSFDCG